MARSMRAELLPHNLRIGARHEPPTMHGPDRAPSSRGPAADCSLNGALRPYRRPHFRATMVNEVNEVTHHNDMTNPSENHFPSAFGPDGSECAGRAGTSSTSTEFIDAKEFSSSPIHSCAVPPNYPRGFDNDVVCSGNITIHIRPIRPDDAPRLAAFHRHLAPHSIYLRFFSFHPYLSERELENFTCVDYEDRFALVAELDGQLLAVGRYDRTPDTTEAEVAFVVADDFQHHGIGGLLLDELARAAMERGITTFVADTLQENHTMLDIFFHSGFLVSTGCEYGILTLRFPIEPTEAYWAAVEWRKKLRQEPKSVFRPARSTQRAQC
jgi:GNAT superfamily N-acetyltransferase